MVGAMAWEFVLTLSLGGGWMSIESLLQKARQDVPVSVWGRAVELARSGGVVGVSDDGDEVHVRVKVRGRALPIDVFL
ncbi:MAG: hypothetical protein ACI9MC_004279, partial [Kiritimatiellia bacterium]